MHQSRLLDALAGVTEWLETWSGHRPRVEAGLVAGEEDALVTEPVRYLPGLAATLSRLVGIG